MRRPSPAILGSIALHGGVVALALVSWEKKDELKPLVSSVPVSIVSEMVIAAAPADNPQPEPTNEDGATAPVEVPEAAPEPTPAPPKPTPPTPTPPRPAPPEPAPPKPTPPRPTPPRPTPTPTPTPRPKPPERPAPAPAPRPTPAPPAKANPAPARPNPAPARPNPTPAPAAKPQPGLDLDSLAGPPRQTPNRGRPAAGQQGTGQASQATGPQLAALGAQVTPNWNLNCDMPGMDNLVIRVKVRLSADGDIIGTPVLQDVRNDPTWRAASDAMLRALRATNFRVPAGFQTQEVPFRFETARQCGNR